MLLQDDGILDLEFEFLQDFTVISLADSQLPQNQFRQQFEDMGLFSEQFLYYVFYRGANILMFLGSFMLLWIVLVVLLRNRKQFKC